jgi:hypothetical protein
MLRYNIRKCGADEFGALGGIINDDTEFGLRANYFIAESNDQLIGYLGYVKNFLSSREEHLFGGTFRSRIEKQGVGTSLLLALEEEARKLDIPVIIHRFTDNGGILRKKWISC